MIGSRLTELFYFGDIIRDAPHISIFVEEIEWHIDRRTESFIIYDESSSPSEDDPTSLRLRRDKSGFAPKALPDRLPDPAGSGIIQLTCRSVLCGAALAKT